MGACRFLQHGLAGFRRVLFLNWAASDRAGAPHCACFTTGVMGKRTLTLGYAIVIIDIFAGAIYSLQYGSYRRDVFPVIRTCRRCLNRFQTILPHAASAVI